MRESSGKFALTAENIPAWRRTGVLEFTRRAMKISIEISIMYENRGKTENHKPRRCRHRCWRWRDRDEISRCAKTVLFIAQDLRLNTLRTV